MSIIGRAFALFGFGKPPPPPDLSPDWYSKDGEFMAWLRAVKPGEAKMLDSWDWTCAPEEDAWVDRVMQRTDWRYEGWLGACATFAHIPRKKNRGEWARRLVGR